MLMYAPFGEDMDPGITAGGIMGGGGEGIDAICGVG